MSNVLNKGNLLDPVLVEKVFNSVKGKSSIAKLCAQNPMPFRGTKEFVFSMDKEVDIVLESGAKSNGGMTLRPVVITPIKVEYGGRVSDEFLNASEEAKIDILQAWNEGFAKKIAKGLDLMVMHGVNPRTGELATQAIGSNSFDTNEDVNVITYDDTKLEDNIEDAIAAIGDYDVTGFAFSRVFATALAKLESGVGISKYPEFKNGGKPDVFAGSPADVNSTVSYGGLDKMIVGDFENCFKWGFAKEIPIKIIEYGNPDNDLEAGDLQGHNQVYLRGEAYIGWGIMDASAFSVIKENDTPLVPETRLSDLKVGNLTLTPTFDKDTEDYAVATTNASNAVTATPMDDDAEVEITCGSSTYESGDSITWEDGENEVSVKVTNGNEVKTYTIVVTKS